MPGPIVERFIEHQARDMQGKAVEFMRARLEGWARPSRDPPDPLEVEVLLAHVGDAVDLLFARRRIVETA